MNVCKKRPIVITIVSEPNKSIININDCSICYEPIKNTDLVKLNCRHSFCAFCIRHILEYSVPYFAVPYCALCRTAITSFDVKNIKIYRLLYPYCDLYL